MAEARVERRLAAILAADVVGYSRLMGMRRALWPPSRPTGASSWTQRSPCTAAGSSRPPGTECSLSYARDWDDRRAHLMIVDRSPEPAFVARTTSRFMRGLHCSEPAGLAEARCFLRCRPFCRPGQICNASSGHVFGNASKSCSLVGSSPNHFGQSISARITGMRSCNKSEATSLLRRNHWRLSAQRAPRACRNSPRARGR